MEWKREDPETKNLKEKEKKKKRMVFRQTLLELDRIKDWMFPMSQ